MDEINNLLSTKYFIVEKLNFEQLEDLLIYFSTSIIEKETEEEIVWDLAKTCIAKLGFEDCVIYLLEDGYLHQKAAHGPKNPKDQDIHRPITIKLGEGITGSVAMTGKPEVIADTRKDPRYIVDDQPRLSEIAVPIVVGELVLGVIDSEHSSPDFFTPRHLKILNAFASICGIKLLNVRKEQALAFEQRKLLQIERQLIDLRVRALKSQMNPHFIFNALNAMQFFITNGEKKNALKYLSVFSKLLRKYLDHLDKDLMTVNEETAVVKGYLALQQLRYNERLEYELKVDDRLTDYLIPSLVLQLAVEDIVERNILENKSGGKLCLSLEKVTGSSYMKAALSMQTIHTSRAVRSVDQTYRKDKIISWKQHIDLLNKLKNTDIVKNVSVAVAGDFITTQFELKVPLKPIVS